MSALSPRPARLLALTALTLAVGAAAFDLAGYGRWATARAGEPADRVVRRLAGPTRSWLPGVLAAVPPDGTILYLADRMSDSDWLAAYYLHPRRLHVVSAAQLAAGARDGSLPDAGWLLAGGRLATWPDRRPVPRAGTAPGFPPPAPGLRGLLALALTALAALGLGSALLSRLGPDRAVAPGPGGRAGLALLAGLGALGAAHFSAAFVGQAGTTWLTFTLTALGVIALAPGWHWLGGPWQVAPPAGSGEPPDPLPLPAALRRALAALVLVLVAAAAIRALGEPMQHWDERFQWAAKAKILLHEGGIQGPGFQDPHRPHLHRRYPLLVPGLEAHTARLAGGFGQERAVKGLFPLFLAGLLLTAHGALRQRLGPGAALALTALLAALPPLHRAPAICGGPAHTGFADLPLAAFGAGLAALAVPAGAVSRARWPAAMLFAGLALLTKPEGIAFAGAAVLMLLAAAARRPRPPAATAGGALLLLALVALPALALSAAVPTEGTVGYTGDEDYLGRLTPERLGRGLERNLPAAAAAMAAAPFTPRWAFLGVLPLAGLVLTGRRRRGGHGLGLLLLLPLAADLLAFTLTGSEIRWHLAVALDRLWLQVAPLLVLVAGGQLGRLAAPPP